MSSYGFDVGSSGYDDEGRLVNWERDDANLDQSWSLSLVGDWDSITENTSTQNRTHGAAHELLTAASQSITHDVKGNMTSIPAVLRPGSDPLALTWDFDNKLVAADVDNDSSDDVTYEYDALGRRVQRDDGTTATVFVQNGQQTFADYTSGTAATSPTYNYVYASYIDEPVYRDGTGGTRYYHRNQQYSITALTDSSATIKERYAYDAYGIPTITDASGTVRATTAEGNRYLFTGREYDDVTDTYHYRARIYLSRLGRFGSRDPIGHESGEFNNYAYLRDDPLTSTDPLGLERCVMYTNPVVPHTYIRIFRRPYCAENGCICHYDEVRDDGCVDLHFSGGIFWDECGNPTNYCVLPSSGCGYRDESIGMIHSTKDEDECFIRWWERTGDGKPIYIYPVMTCWTVTYLYRYQCVEDPHNPARNPRGPTIIPVHPAPKPRKPPRSFPPEGPWHGGKTIF